MGIFIALVVFFTMDALDNDWRDRFNSKSIIYRFFDWLHRHTGSNALWAWYAGTREGPLKRFLGVPYDAWHTFKHIRNASLAYVCYDINGWWGVATVIFLAAVWFPTLYNNFLISDDQP